MSGSHVPPLEQANIPHGHPDGISTWACPMAYMLGPPRVVRRRHGVLNKPPIFWMNFLHVITTYCSIKSDIVCEVSVVAHVHISATFSSSSGKSHEYGKAMWDLDILAAVLPGLQCKPYPQYSWCFALRTMMGTGLLYESLWGIFVDATVYHWCCYSGSWSFVYLCDSLVGLLFWHCDFLTPCAVAWHSCRSAYSYVYSNTSVWRDCALGVYIRQSFNYSSDVSRWCESCITFLNQSGLLL